MQELVRLFVQIALLRKGPQDLPASRRVLAATVAGFFTVHCLVSALLPPIRGPWLYEIVVDVVFTLAWYLVLLRLANRPERFLQTSTAVFGYQAVLAPPGIATIWLLRQHIDDESWRLPIALLGLAWVVWGVAANARVVKAALEWGMAASVALVILQTLVREALILYLLS